MSRHVFRSRRRLATQRLLAVLALVGYWSATIGVPIPQSPRKDGGEPFPCQGHHCGCQNAAACWRTCCCYSATEKVAWARAKAVEPPAAAVVEAALEWNSPRQRDAEITAAACARCTERAGRNCRSATATPVPAASCRSSSDRNDETSATTWHVSVSPVKCQGLISLWLQNGTVCPPAPVVRWSPNWDCVARVSPIKLAPCQLPHSPPIPPPRDLG